MEISLRICMRILGLKGLTQYKTSKEVVAEQAKRH